MGYVAGAAPQYFGRLSWKFGWTEDGRTVCVWQNRTQNTATLHGVEYVGGTKLLVVRTGTATAYVAEARRKARFRRLLLGRRPLQGRHLRHERPGNSTVDAIKW
ncbi:hypothetical protein [Streptomyces sp. NRRL B-3648]|uniref:hypothetical protein n=1 Tax=Streptomyces sp. NRRL B-3648 TaxID=1519493 RepID=UPI0006ADEC13|nr:hypothetical protein [Streptomyces sp. NRRL B-3648]KOX05279.1 hypothetical protein ADL04_07475 [Streptomyces sp. NRRL B-3648]